MRSLVLQIWLACVLTDFSSERIYCIIARDSLRAELALCRRADAVGWVVVMVMHMSSGSNTLQESSKILFGVLLVLVTCLR